MDERNQILSDAYCSLVLFQDSYGVSGDTLKFF